MSPADNFLQKQQKTAGAPGEEKAAVAIHAAGRAGRATDGLAPEERGENITLYR